MKKIFILLISVLLISCMSNNEYINTVKSIQLPAEVLGANTVEQLIVRVIEIDSKSKVTPSAIKWEVYESKGNEKTLKASYKDYNFLIPTTKQKDFVFTEPIKIVGIINGRTINLVQLIFQYEFEKAMSTPYNIYN